VSQSYAGQPVKTIREIPRYVDSPCTLAASLLGIAVGFRQTLISRAPSILGTTHWRKAAH
jgi:hypothetical protein